MMYKISEWDKRYEVSSKGREPKEGEALRAGPLRYIRLKVYGHSQGAGFRRMQMAAGVKSMEIFGIFCKFLEISGNQPSEKRGVLLNEKDGPANTEDLAFILGVPEKQIKNAIRVLSSENVGWIEDSTQLNLTQLNTTQGTGNIPENPEIPGKNHKPSKIKHLEYVLLKQEEYDKLVTEFGLEGTKERISDLNNYIGSKGKKYKSHYHTILAWERNNSERKAIQTDQREFESITAETSDYGIVVRND